MRTPRRQRPCEPADITALFKPNRCRFDGCPNQLRRNGLCEQHAMQRTPRKLATPTPFAVIAAEIEHLLGTLGPWQTAKQLGVTFDAIERGFVRHPEHAELHARWVAAVSRYRDTITTHGTGGYLKGCRCDQCITTYQAGRHAVWAKRNAA